MNPKYNDKISNKSNFDDFESNNRNKFICTFHFVQNNSNCNSKNNRNK